MLSSTLFTTLLIKSVPLVILNLLVTKMIMITKFSHLEEDDVKLMGKQVNNIGFIIVVVLSLFI